MGMNDINSLSHSKWNCKYHIVFAPKYRSRSVSGSYPFVLGNTAKAIDFRIHGMPGGEKCGQAV